MVYVIQVCWQLAGRIRKKLEFFIRQKKNLQENVSNYPFAIELVWVWMQITKLLQTIFRNIFHTTSQGLRIRISGSQNLFLRLFALARCQDGQKCSGSYDRLCITCAENWTFNFRWLIFCRCYNFLLLSHFLVKHIVLVTALVYWNIFWVGTFEILFI